MPADKKQAIVDRQISIATSEASNHRQATAAARVLVSMESLNVTLATSPTTSEPPTAEAVTPLQILMAMRATIPKREVNH